MSSFGNVLKGGWHPEKNSSSSSSGSGGLRARGKDTVSGWVGKKKQSDYERAQDHSSTPLSQLQDPDSFGPPPRRTGTSASVSSASSPALTLPRTTVTPSIGGLGGALTRTQLEEDRRKAQERADAQREEEERPRYNTGPYKADTTGLSTANLPKPPQFRGANRVGTPDKALPAKKPPPPSLPPRLPPRQASAEAVEDDPPPPPYMPASTHAALGRLSAAGVRVPGLGIGSSQTPARTAAASPPLPLRHTPPPAAQTGTASSNRLSELQSRFAKLGTGSTSPAPPAATAETTTPANSTGTTWAQKQAALKTARDFHQNPSTVSLSDARSAASTANNFRERHGEQVATGWKAANSFNQKYGVAERAKELMEPASASPQPASGDAGQETGVIGVVGKKAPPPPPVKKVGLGAGPPPVPLASKPSLP